MATLAQPLDLQRLAVVLVVGLDSGTSILERLALCAADLAKIRAAQTAIGKCSPDRHSRLGFLRPTVACSSCLRASPLGMTLRPALLLRGHAPRIGFAPLRRLCIETFPVL